MTGEKRGVRKCGRNMRDLNGTREDGRTGNTLECVTADGDVCVRVRSEGGEFKHKYSFGFSSEV